MNEWHLNAFGLSVSADFALPGAASFARLDTSASLRLRRVEEADVPRPGGEARFLRGLFAFDGLGLAILEGEDGHVLFQYGRSARFLLSPDYRELRCWARYEADARWRRVLLDTILWTVSLLRGFELLHACAVEVPVGVVAVMAASGGGKTSLAAELMRRGGRLFADDVVALDEPAGALVRAHPGPRLMNVPAAVDLRELPRARAVHYFGDETWVALSTEEPRPRPLTAIVVLDRRPQTALECVVKPATALTVLAHMKFLTDLYEAGPAHAAREERRFWLAASLAEQVPTLQLTAPLDVPPERLADALDSATSRL